MSWLIAQRLMQFLWHPVGRNVFPYVIWFCVIWFLKEKACLRFRLRALVAGQLVKAGFAQIQVGCGWGGLEV